jgi:hypothetical protein
MDLRGLLGTLALPTLYQRLKSDREFKDQVISGGGEVGYTGIV